ncbi:uncharacterized protein [Rutidosis leptorrhynchoides]|uniref:uncharacterized protein n=1 Tax=Rutidosis leptorrhynchoides TaxID=125765 RepID=UPI003A98E301
MRLLSINIRGCKKRKKRVWIKEMCYANNIQFLGVQESKMERLELFRIKSMWGNYSFDYACSLSRGMSGGIISFWDPSFFFVKERVWSDENYLIVKGKWVGSDVDYFMINVYGPHNSIAKASLWDRLYTFISSNVGEFVLFGDMNEVRTDEERFGSVFNGHEARVFNSFIDNTGLVDLQLNGRRFTWMNKVASKMSRIDRVLVSPNALPNGDDYKLEALNCIHLDHFPLLFHDKKVDYERDGGGLGELRVVGSVCKQQPVIAAATTSSSCSWLLSLFLTEMAAGDNSSGGVIKQRVVVIDENGSVSVISVVDGEVVICFWFQNRKREREKDER